MTQSQFLGSLGINFRVEALLQNCTEEQAESLRTGYWRLVGDGEAPFWEGPEDQTPIGMGTRYLAMAIVNKKQGTPIPFEWKLRHSYPLPPVATTKRCNSYSIVEGFWWSNQAGTISLCFLLYTQKHGLMTMYATFFCEVMKMCCAYSPGGWSNS